MTLLTMTHLMRLDEIANCPHARNCIGDATAANPCRKIVEYQSKRTPHRVQMLARMVKE